MVLDTVLLVLLLKQQLYGTLKCQRLHKYRTFKVTVLLTNILKLCNGFYTYLVCENAIFMVLYKLQRYMNYILTLLLLLNIPKPV